MGQARSRAPRRGEEGEIELRQVFDLDDFCPGEAIDRARELEKELAKKKQAGSAPNPKS